MAGKLDGKMDRTGPHENNNDSTASASQGLRRLNTAIRQARLISIPTSIVQV
jgi:hypothetical protein